MKKLHTSKTNQLLKLEDIQFRDEIEILLRLIKGTEPIYDLNTNILKLRKLNNRWFNKMLDDSLFQAGLKITTGIECNLINFFKETFNKEDFLNNKDFFFNLKFIVVRLMRFSKYNLEEVYVFISILLLSKDFNLKLPEMYHDEIHERNLFLSMDICYPSEDFLDNLIGTSHPNKETSLKRMRNSNEDFETREIYDIIGMEYYVIRKTSENTVKGPICKESLDNTILTSILNLKKSIFTNRGFKMSILLNILKRRKNKKDLLKKN